MFIETQYTKNLRKVSSSLLYYYFDQQGVGFVKTFKKLKDCLGDCSIIDAKIFFVNPTLRYLMCSETCTPIVRHCSSRTSLDFYFDQESVGIPRILRNLKLCIFFLDCSIVDAKLLFVPRYSVVSAGALIEIDVCL